MTKKRRNIKLTEAQEDDIIRRAKISARCSEWAKQNGPAFIAGIHGVDPKAVSNLAERGQSKAIPEEAQYDILKRYKNYKRVQAVWRRNSRSQLRREYGVSDDRIGYMLGERKINGRKHKDWTGTAVGKFMTMHLPCSFVGAVGYY